MILLERHSSAVTLVYMFDISNMKDKGRDETGNVTSGEVQRATQRRGEIPFLKVEYICYMFGHVIPSGGRLAVDNNEQLL